MFDNIAIAVALLGVGLIASGMAWLGRKAGFKAVAVLLAAAALSFGGGVWLLWP